MIRVEIQLDRAKTVQGFSASGHAPTGSYGKNIVCAAATALLRTVAGVLAARPELNLQGTAGTEGEMVLRIGSPEAADAGFLQGVTACLVLGLRDLARENPGELDLSITYHDSITNKEC